jgi:uncharacterized phiE125 gp8 family phage protein
MYEQYPDPSFNDRLINPQELPWTWTFRVKTPALAAPVTLDEVKKFGRLDSVDEDDLIQMFIAGATQAAEEYMGRSIMQQTIVMAMDFFPGIIALLPRFLATSAAPVPLARLPLVTVTAMRTLNEDGSTLENWDLSNAYWMAGDDGRFVIRKGSVPPINVERYRAGFEIEYTAGYGAIGATADDQRKAVPMPIRLGIMLWTAAMYSARGSARGGATEPPPEAKPMLDPYKVIRI